MAGVESELFVEAGAEVHQRDICVAQEGVDDLLRALVTQRQWQRTLAAVARDEGARLALGELAEAARGVAFEGLDLDHVCAALGEQLGAEWDSDKLPELDDADTGEWLWHRPVKLPEDRATASTLRLAPVQRGWRIRGRPSALCRCRGGPGGPQHQTFTWLVPEGIDVQRGSAVIAPWRDGFVLGIVVRLTRSTEVDAPRPIERVIGAGPLLSAEQLEIAEWMAERYLAPLFSAIALFLPPGTVTRRARRRRRLSA